MLLIVFVPAQSEPPQPCHPGKPPRRRNPVCEVTANILRPLGLKRKKSDNQPPGAVKVLTTLFRH
jgi:hypothetical protein